MRRALSVLWPCLALVFGAAAASAQGAGDPAKVQAARDLAEEGFALYQEQRYEEALDRLDRAFRMVDAPTIEALRGDVLVELGRFIEAREAYEHVVRSTLPADAPPAFAKAQAKASEALAALKPRIPGVTVVIEGPAPPGLRVTVDGRELEAAAIGVRWPVDPGDHVIEVTAARGPIASRAVALDAGQHERVVVVVTSEGTPPRAGAAEPEAPRRPPQRTLAWVSLGVGAAGLGVGVGAGAVMLSKKRTLDDGCGDVCPPELRDDHDAFRSARTASWVGYGVGLAAGGLGAVLLVTSNKQRERGAKGTLMPYIAPGGLGVEGRF